MGGQVWLCGQSTDGNLLYRVYIGERLRSESEQTAHSAAKKGQTAYKRMDVYGELGQLPFCQQALSRLRVYYYEPYTSECGQFVTRGGTERTRTTSSPPPN